MATTAADMPIDGTGASIDKIVSSIELIIVSGVIKQDPYLEPFRDVLRRRFAKTQEWVKTINDTEGGMEKYTKVI